MQGRRWPREMPSISRIKSKNIYHYHIIELKIIRGGRKEERASLGGRGEEAIREKID